MRTLQLSYKWQVAIVMALGLFMAVLDNTIVSVALPQMQHAFATDFSTITWVATGYFLAQAAVIPVVGYLSDRIGTRVIFLFCLGLFTLGSALCAIAGTEQWLIAFRVLQGIGGGGLFPLAFAIVYRVFPPTERGPASAIIGVPVLLAPAFGPTIGGYLTTTFSWNAIFTINIPVGILSFILSLLVLRSGHEEMEEHMDKVLTKRSFDWLGLILVMVGCTVLVYGISEASSRGWGDALVIWSLIGGGLTLAAFVVTELLVSDPVLDVRLFLNYTFTTANLLIWLIAGVLFGSLFLLPFFFENVQKLLPLNAGEFLIAQGLATTVGVVISGTLYNRIGPRIIVTLGFVLMTIGTIGLIHLDVATTGQSLQGWLILRGLGLGLSNIPLQTLALSAISNKAMARASSLVNVTRQIAGAIGVSALTTYLAQQATSYGHDVATALQKRPLTGVAATCAPLMRQGKEALKECVTQHVTVAGLNDTFTLVLIGTAVAIVLAIFIGRDPALEAMKQARARGETVEVAQPALAGE